MDDGVDFDRERRGGKQLSRPGPRTRRGDEIGIRRYFYLLRPAA
jgi:hypothetical protein